jgi:hypothetical protein
MAPMPSLRLAAFNDAAAVDDLMKASTRDIFPPFYDPRQTKIPMSDGTTIAGASMQKPIS